jgi:hypothetical protein
VTRGRIVSFAGGFERFTDGDERDERDKNGVGVGRLKK